MNRNGVLSAKSAAVPTSSESDPDYVPPAPPTGVTAVADCGGTTTQVLVSWAPNLSSDAVATYLVYRKPEFSGGVCTAGHCGATVASGVTSYTDTTVTGGADYQYTVAAKDLPGNLSAESVPAVAAPLNRTTSLLKADMPVPAAKAVDGQVTIRVPIQLTPPTGSTFSITAYPKMRIYRKLNAQQSCLDYQSIAELRTSSYTYVQFGGVYYPYLEFKDTGVQNNAAYDYALTFLNASEQESLYSKMALAIPLTPPKGYKECVESYPSADPAIWEDGADKACLTCSIWERLKVWAQRPTKPYQLFTSSGEDELLALNKGLHLYTHVQRGASDYYDNYLLTPVPVDFAKAHCSLHTDVPCLLQWPTDPRCPSGETCVVDPQKKCSKRGTSACYNDNDCFQWYGDCVNNVCGTSQRACLTNSDCRWMDTCTVQAGVYGSCRFEGDTQCMVDADCFQTSGNICMNQTYVDPYLNKYADNAFYTYTNDEIGYNPGMPLYYGCIALKEAYGVFVNGKWIDVESGFSDAFDSSEVLRPSFRCKVDTPNTGAYDMSPGCQSKEGPPPQPLAAPTVSSTSPNTVTVSWPPAGICKTSASWYCTALCEGGSSCVGCPSTDLGCTANDYYEPYTTTDGHCVYRTSTACDNAHPCISPYNDQVCEMTNDGYYIYETGPDTSDFSPMVPAQTVDRNTTSFTFTGLSPSVSLSFKIATFVLGGRVSQQSPVSSIIKPMAPDPVAVPVPAPANVEFIVKSSIGGVSINSSPGGTYTGTVTYKLYRSTTKGGPYTLLASSGFDTTAVPNTVYYYVLTATATGGTSPFSREVAGRALPKMDPYVLTPPLNLDAHAGYIWGTDWARVKINWCRSTTEQLNVTGYRLYRSQVSNGPYIPMQAPNTDIPSACVDGIHRCEITRPIASNPNCLPDPNNPNLFCMSAPTTYCRPGANGTCGVIDMTVKTPIHNLATDTGPEGSVYFYVVTVVARNNATGQVWESPYSSENQGWPSYCLATVANSDLTCRRYDPDPVPETPCYITQHASLQLPAAAADAAVAQLAISSVDEPLSPPSDALQALPEESDEIAPYRVIAGKVGGGGGGPPGGGAGGPFQTVAYARFIYFHLDHLGSPRVIVGSDTKVISTHHYMPFGDELPVMAQASSNTRQFTGHERDDESGMDYMLARYYSSSLDRFMSVDPSRSNVAPSNPQTWNRYTYSDNNPLKYVDPDGRQYIAADVRFSASMQRIGQGGSATGHRVMDTFAKNKTNPVVGKVVDGARWEVFNAKNKNVDSIYKPDGSRPSPSEIIAKGGVRATPDAAASSPAAGGQPGQTVVYLGSKAYDPSGAGMSAGQWIDKEVVHETTHQNGGTQAQAEANEDAFVKETTPGKVGTGISNHGLLPGSNVKVLIDGVDVSYR